MAKLISDIRDFVSDVASDVARVATDSLPRRKIALITGITGQVGIRKDE